MNIPIDMRHTPKRHNGTLEILDHPAWIRHLAFWIEPRLYVEYGISSGRCVEQIAPLCRQVWGVDLAPYETKTANYSHYHMTTRQFHDTILQVKKPVIDLAFIDACHESDEVMQDFEELFPFIAQNGFICLHDTYPIREEYSNPMFCSDSWKVPELLRAKYGSQIELLTLPFMPGLTIVRKCEAHATPRWTEQ